MKLHAPTYVQWTALFAALCAVLSACSDSKPEPLTDAAIDAAGQLDSRSKDGLTLRPISDGGQKRDGAQDVDAAQILDAGGDAAHLVGVADPDGVGEYLPGIPFDTTAGCMPGFVNCDGERSTGCELELGCPTAINSLKCTCDTVTSCQAPDACVARACLCGAPFGVPRSSCTTCTP